MPRAKAKSACLALSSLKVAALLFHVSLLLPIALVSGFFFLHGVGGLCRDLSLVPEGVQPRLFREEALRAGAGVVLGACGSSLLIPAAPATGLAAPGMVCGRKATEGDVEHSRQRPRGTPVPAPSLLCGLPLCPPAQAPQPVPPTAPQRWGSWGGGLQRTKVERFRVLGFNSGSEKQQAVTL